MFANEIQHGVRQRGGVVVASARTWLRHFGVQNGQPGAVRGGLLLEFAWIGRGIYTKDGDGRISTELSAGECCS